MTDLIGRLSPGSQRILETIVAAAKRRGVSAYLVGGAVRDLLSRRRPRDLDVAIEGDAVAFARIWASEYRRTLAAPSRFGTIRSSDLETVEIRVEFATSRREKYAAPAALPQVWPASIDEDLRRRDFSVNAMAFGVSGPRSGELIDPTGGRRDLSLHVLRLLHEGSISDDPTRAFRAVRYAERLGFRIDASSLAQIDRARADGTFGAVSGPRLRREVELLLGECGSAGLKGLGQLRLESTILPRLRVSAPALARLKRARQLTRGAEAIDTPRLLLLAWLSELSAESARTAAGRLDFRAESLRSMTSIGTKRRIAIRASVRARISGQLGLEIRDWSAEEAIAAASWIPASRARRFLGRWREARKLRLGITGADLIRSGIPAGPAIGRAIEAVWKARLEGKISSRQEATFATKQAGGR